MKAIRIHEFGPPEALRYEEAPVPEPGPRDLLIKIEAASVNHADLFQREGRYRGMPPALPMVLGLEFAGAVAAVGAEVQGFQVGQRVVANPGSGGYAEYAAVRASVARPVPEGIELARAAAVPVAFLTAWFALHQEAGMQAGDRVLIHAGGSGVGIAAIQIAKHAGARVLITAGSDEKCMKAHNLGADDTINYAQRDFVREVQRLTGGRGVDIVLDTVGAAYYERSLGILAPGGRLVNVGRSAGSVPDPPPPPPEGRRAGFFSLASVTPPRGNGLETLSTLFDLMLKGGLRVILARTLPLAEAAEAHRYLEERRAFGKVVLVV
ncbi:MAG: zinc-binding dehydrogenase [Chloroflexi bacterium]|nr:zinc-binding dehydrogenase [Chloroflexota bacterium]